MQKLMVRADLVCIKLANGPNLYLNDWPVMDAFSMFSSFRLSYTDLIFLTRSARISVCFSFRFRAY